MSQLDNQFEDSVVKSEPEDSDNDEKSSVLKEKGEKKPAKAGIIYLSTMPPKMNVTQIREYFSQHGEINRSFLQPEEKPWRKKGKVKNQVFTEGWIEFKKRKHAKRVAVMLNNQPVGGKKSKPYHDHLWSIKYLQGFQWVHLNERLAYERISRQQKLRNEISAAKRETSFFAKNVDLSKKLKRKGLLNKSNSAVNPETKTIPNSSNDEINSRSTIQNPVISKEAITNSTKRKTVNEKPNRAKFLKGIFGNRAND